MTRVSKKQSIQPLKGFTIIDLTYLFPGGYCTRFLADHGARVIRVERPDDVFYLTDIWPWGNDASSTMRRTVAPRFFQINCNKESLTLDYTSQKGKELLVDLVRKVDVLVEGYRPGVMERYGLGYSQLRKVNPDLIYCSVTGYGQEGPYAQLPAHDPNIQAFGGIMALTQGPDGPGLPGIPIGDILAGSNAAIAILMSLIARARSNTGGQHLDISMLDSVVWAMGLCRADAYFATGKYLGPSRRSLHIFKTRDERYICLVILEKKFWQTLCNRLSLGEYLEDWAVINPFGDDTPRRQEIVARLTEIFKTRTRSEWFEFLSDCCLTPVYSFEEVLEDVNTKAHQLLVWLNTPELGSLPYLGIPFRMSKTRGQMLRVPPLKGEQNGIILSELGRSKNRNPKAQR